MTTKDSTLVRLPNATLARLDARRGGRSRAEFLDELLDDRPLAAIPRRPASVRKVDHPPISSCRHPVGRRIGDRCGECGAATKGKG